MKREYPVQQVVNWFFGNYCTRKCLEKDGQLFKCRQKLEEFAEKHSGTIRHREFLELMQNGLNICELPAEQKTKAISYKEFARKQDGDCPLCKKLGIY